MINERETFQLQFLDDGQWISMLSEPWLEEVKHAMKNLRGAPNFASKKMRILKITEEVVYEVKPDQY